MSTIVGVRDLRNSLSRWLRLVRGGEIVIVLDRGQAVAVLSALTGRGSPRTVADHLGGPPPAGSWRSPGHGVGPGAFHG